MLTTSPWKVAAAAVALVVFGGCYGAKLVKGPVNSDHAAIMTDSLLTENQLLRGQLASIERQLAEEREERRVYQAQTGVTLAEMEESMRILIARIEENAQTQSRFRIAPRVAPRPVMAADTSTSDSSLVKAGGSEDDLYRAAYLDLNRGDYELAIKGFQNYLVRHPTGIYLPEVHYYLGECHYARDRYLEAVGEFRWVADKYPDSRLVPAAYLKTGRCYEQLEEKNLAVRAFRELIDQHPDTEEAEQAREALDALEG
jgi:tol-pal system protein YbgF